MKRITVPLLVCCSALSLLACGGTQEPPRAPVPVHNEDQPTAPSANAQLDKPDDPQVLSIGRGIREACGISQAEAYFDYNSASVDQGASDVLAKIAECFSSGPLAGKTLVLVGHTDPRGDEEYNYALGGRRAAKVQQRLLGYGLAEDHTQASSRGETEASGVDESSWRSDRRVDLVLGS